MHGIEIEMQAMLSETLGVDIKYAWQDAMFGEFVSTEGDFSGNAMPAAPEHAFTVALNKSVSLGEYGELSLNASYAWKDDQYFNFKNSDLALQDAYGVAQSCGLVGSG
jgi:hypothetical protein